MNSAMQRAQGRLAKLIEHDIITAGMPIRIHGDHLILRRPDPQAPSQTPQDDDRVRLARSSQRTYGVSVKRHTGRWEKTPFVGNLEDMVNTIRSVMQHLAVPY